MIRALAALVDRVRRRDDAALAEVIALTESWLMLRLRRHGLQEHDAEDIAVQVYFELWRRATSVQDATRSLAWLGCVADRMARRRCIEIRREQSRSVDASATLVAPAPRTFEGEADAVLTRLSKEERTVISLRFLEGLSVKQVAEKTGLTPHQIDYLTKRGRDHARGFEFADESPHDVGDADR